MTAGGGRCKPHRLSAAPTPLAPAGSTTGCTWKGKASVESWRRGHHVAHARLAARLVPGRGVQRGL